MTSSHKALLSTATVIFFLMFILTRQKNITVPIIHVTLCHLSVSFHTVQRPGGHWVHSVMLLFLVWCVICVCLDVLWRLNESHLLSLSWRQRGACNTGVPFGNAHKGWYIRWRWTACWWHCASILWLFVICICHLLTHCSDSVRLYLKLLNISVDNSTLLPVFK